MQLHEEEQGPGYDEAIVGDEAEGLEGVAFPPDRDEDQHQGKRNQLTQLNSYIEGDDT